MSHHHKKEFRLNHPELEKLHRSLDRRNFLNKTAMGFGAMALQSLLAPAQSFGNTLEQDIMKALPKIAPKAKRVV